MSHRVLFSPEAQADLEALYDYIAEQASPDVALTYVSRLEGFCQQMQDFPERGAQRNDLRQGLRVIGFERRATIAFHVSDNAVTIDRILYGGRDLEGILAPRR